LSAVPRRPLNLIAGEPTTPSASVGAASDPATGEPLGDMPASPATDIHRALDVAYAAWGNGDGSFARRPLDARLADLERIARALDERADAFAYWHAREIGIPIATTRLLSAGLGDVVRGIAETAPAVLEPQRAWAGGRRVEVHRLPWGPAALYTAWNAPAFLAMTKLAYALAAGCPAIIKPSEHAGATTGLLVGALCAADLEPGAAQVVCGGPETGARLAADSRVRMISYTGGTAGGRAVAAAAIGRMTALQLELSAANPAVVTADADLENAAAELAQGATVLNGQWCEAPRRVYVHASAHDELVERLGVHLRRRRLGEPLAEETELGPLARKEQLDTVNRAIARLGRLGRVDRSHDALPSRGWYLSPTVVSQLPRDAVDGEIFGPVLAVAPYDDLEDAIRAANALADGLAGYVFAGKAEDGFRIGMRLHAGEIRLGGARVLDLAPGSMQSFWGTSGTGGHGREDVLRAHTGARIVGEEDHSLPL
jgi:betaine-aldehyde dehydrogenase